MNEGNGAGGVLRIERGAVDETEVAAVTAVLLSVLAAARDAGTGDRGSEHTAGPRRRWERNTPYRAPHSWH